MSGDLIYFESGFCISFYMISEFCTGLVSMKCIKVVKNMNVLCCIWTKSKTM